MKGLVRTIIGSSLILLFAGSVCSTAVAADKNAKKGQAAKLQKGAADRPIEQYRVHKVGKLWTAISNFGNYGDPQVPDRFPSFEWPGGSGTNYQWEGRLWIGALVGDEPRVSHADYGNYEWQPSEGSDYFMGPGKSIEDGFVEFDDFNASVASTAPLGIKVRQRALTWSTDDFDDFLAFEYEIINEKGDEFAGGTLNQLFVSWVYDADIGTGTDPSEPHIDDLVDFDGWDGVDSDTDLDDVVENIDWNEDGVWEGYDERGIPYAWEHVGNPDIPSTYYDPSKIAPDGFYDEYTVLLDDDGPPLRWQTATNPAGAAAGEIAVLNGKELHGYAVPRNMSYMYDGDHGSTPENDTGENGKVPGFIGGRLLYTPLPPYNTSDDDTLMRAYSHQWWNWESDPPNDLAKYQFATATHEASQGRHFQLHPFKLGAPVFDYRFDQSTGPFNNFAVGDTIRLVFVGGVGYGLQGIRENVDNALRAYYTGSERSDPYHPSAPNEDLHWVLPVPPPVPNLVYTPGAQSVKLAWDNVAETSIDPLIGSIDFEGYRVYRSKYTPGNWEMVGAFDMVDGPVDVIDPATKEVLATGVDLPDITHTFTDQGGNFLGRAIEPPINNLPYYYAVAAYDPFKPADPASGRPAFESIESARVNFAVDPKSGAPVPIVPRRLYEAGEKLGALAEMGIKVYPNPYKGASLLEERYQDKIAFTNLPPVCKITIYTPTGDRVDEIFHTDGSEEESWELISRNEQDVVSGLYLYVVETEAEKFMGKFVVIRGE